MDMRNRLTALFTLLVISAIATNATATTYYVRTTGDDGNSGRLASSAFKTIKRAAEVIQNGDTVYVGAGTYTDDIVINGVQRSDQPARFIVEFGDAIVSASWKVVNSNYVQITGFKFQGTTSRFLVWQGSYEGLLSECEFTAGAEGLLINSGSLTIDNCQIQDFTKDGIQVDGEAEVLVTGSTISGCQQAGVEVRKVARVSFDNCTLSNQVGDGIKVNITTDSIDTGIEDGGNGAVGLSKYLAAGMNQIELSSGFIRSYNSDIGRSSVGNNGVASSNGEIKTDGQVYGRGFIGPQGTARGSDFSGGLTVLEVPLAPASADPGDAATNNSNGGIPRSDKGGRPLNGSKFSLSGRDGVDLPPGTYFFSELVLSGGSIIRISGPTKIYASKVDLSGGSVSNPAQKPLDLQIYPTGEFKLSGDSRFFGVVYGPGCNVSLSGSSTFFGMLVGKEIKFSNSGGMYVDLALSSLADQLAKDGSSTSSSPAPPNAWKPISHGVLNVSSSTLSGNSNGVRMVTEQTFNSRFSNYTSNTNFGLELYGTCQIQDLSINSNGIGGIRLNHTGMNNLTVSRLTIANNQQYGVYAESSYLAFNSVNIADWAISGSQIGVAATNSDVTFENVTMSGGSTAAVQLTRCNMKAANATYSGSGYGLGIDTSNAWMWNCTFSGNTVGLYAAQNTHLSVSDSTFTGNSAWGASVSPSSTTAINRNTDAAADRAATATLTGCVFHSNAGGVSIVNAIDGEVLLRGGTVIRDNTAAGLHFENCKLTVNDQAGGANWSSVRNLYGISSNGSALALSNIKLQDSRSYSVFSMASSVSLSGCTLIGQHGIYTGQAHKSLSIDKSVFDSGLTPGVGVVRYAGTFSVKNSTFDGYFLGIYLYSPSGSDQATIFNTTIANSTEYGLYVYGGVAELRNTILTGDGTGYGIMQIGGTLTHTHNLLHGFSIPYYGTTADATEVQNNPLFVNAAGGDFHLSAGSPAINVGMDVGSSVATDMEGNARPSYKRYEMGSYEYMDADGSLRILSWQEEK